MTAGIARRAPDAVADREPRRVRLVLDVEFALDEVVASLLRSELMSDATVDVVLLLPRLSWSTDAALVAPGRRRLVQARQRRIGGAGVDRWAARRSGERHGAATPLEASRDATRPHPAIAPIHLPGRTRR